MIEISQEQSERFHEDGFVVIEGVVDELRIRELKKRFVRLFRGEFETGVQPDEWNWREGRDANDLTRQICNGWKADNMVASVVLREDIGRACAQLRGWSGARINQDNVLWKPPAAKALGFHQDESYQSWIVPSQMMTCWITLDDTALEQGTIEYVRGSHRWPLAPPIRQFHAPEDPLADAAIAASHAGETLELVPIVVAAGSAVFHHGRVWHGSRVNRGEHPRRSVVAHCMAADTVFDAENKSPVYSRYQRRDSLKMDESFFPVLWREDGYRTDWLKTLKL
ncbi:phytanoyl-CoA dioxygenase [Chromatiales bacterium (ex Bugula neritina AB1)]|nr:phytanoyl-CoA dioxygenase [Chromatiales bacterium (ex Bugula neritina AB1)]